MSEDEVFIFEVSKNSFNTSVILNSYKVPVFVEYMNIWSEPCISMADNLSSLAKEFAGQFIFAKVDIDEQAELAEEHAIKNAPSLKIYKDGEVIRSEEGLLPDDEIRQLLKTYGVFRQSDDLREQARLKHMNGDTIEAINLLTQAIQQDPANTRVAMDMVQVFLDINELEQAKSLFNKLPDNDKNGDTGKSLIGQLTFRDLALKTRGKADLLAHLADKPEDNDARFDLSICLVAEHDYQQAMNYLFEIFDHQPDYKDGAAREMIINLTNMLAPNEPQLAQEFRRRLGSALA